MVNDPRYLWWAQLFDGWLTTDRPSGGSYDYDYPNHG
jgi:hypothetical protein